MPGLADRISQRAAANEIRRAVDPVSLEEFGALLADVRGGHVTSKSGVVVSAKKAQSIPAWWRGVRYLTETVAGLPIASYRTRPGDLRERRALPRWLRRPHDEIPRFALLEHFMMSMLHRGNGFAWKVRSPALQVVGMLPIHPDRVRFGVVDSRKVFEIRGEGGEAIPATSFEVFHVPALSADGYFGIDPIRAHAASLGVALAADEYAGRYFSNSAGVGAYISLPGRLDDDEAKVILSQWNELHQGVRSAHKFGVIGDGATYNTIGLDPEQSQLLESRKFTVTEVARLLGVPPHKLYDLERATFSNIEHQAIESVTDSILPWCRRFELWASHDPTLVRSGNFLEFNLEGLLRGDTQSRYEAINNAVGGPWQTINENRRRENLPPIEGGDTVLQPLNMAPVGSELANDPQGGD